MITGYTIEEITVDELTATDLCNEAQGEANAEAARVWFEVDGVRKAEPGQALFFNGWRRGGVVWGAEATWTDCDDIADAVRRYVEDDIIA